MAASLALNAYILAKGMEFDSFIYQNYFAALWVFLLGMLLYYERGRLARLPGKKIVAAVAFVAFFDIVTRRPDMDIETGFYIGVLLAACITVVLAQITWPGWFRRIDRVAGDFAYGVFLNHFIAGLLLLTANELILRERGTFDVFGRVNHPGFGYWTMGVSLMLAAAMFMLFERPLHAYRDRVRRLTVAQEEQPVAAPAPVTSAPAGSAA